MSGQDTVMSSEHDPTVWSIIGLGAGLYYFFKGFREYRKYRVLADTPEIPIRSVAMGLVEVHGKAKGEQRVISPVSHTPCYYYKVAIERWEKDSKGRGSWHNYKSDFSGVRFYLEDETGHVLVDAQGAEFDLEQTARREVGSGMGIGLTSLFGGEKTTSSALSLSASRDELFDYVASVASGIAVPRICGDLPPNLDAGAPGGLGSAPTPEQAQQELEMFRR